MRELQKQILKSATESDVQRASQALEDDSWSDLWPPRLHVLSVLDLTEDVLHRSGIERGMHVLDLGCGVGDTSFYIAKMVGPAGLVIGVDRSAKAIDLAQKRATVAGQCYWTRFLAADLDTFVLQERFDAAVVRPAHFRRRENAAVLRLSGYVRPDGVVVVVSGKA
jgi:cyclopropane fatty-acyl-phospholipid synthase-like methyltransferase